MIAPRHASSPLRDALRAPWQHKGKALSFFVVVMSVALAVTFLLPKTYRSESKLLLRLGRENMSLDPTAMLGTTPLVGMQQSRETELNSAVDILQSRLLIERVVDAVGPAKILGDDDDAKTLAAASGPASPDEREKAIRRMERSLNVDAVRKSAIVQITYEAPNPELAQVVVAKLVDFFLDEHIRLNRTPGAEEFLAEQTTATGHRLQESEERLRALKDETGLAAPQEQRTIAVARIGRLQDELLQTDAALASTEAEVKRLRGQLTALPEREITEETEGFANEAADGMRQQLYALEIKEQDLASKFTDDHPQLQQVREQMAEAKQVLTQEQPKRTQTTTAPSKLHEEVRLLLLKQQPVLAAQQAKADHLRTQLTAEQETLKQLNDGALRVARLQREAELEETNYRRYVESLEQARIDGAIAAEGKSNISIVQPATFERKPIRPKVLMNIALALAIGGLGGLGLAFAAASLDDSAKPPTDLELRLEVPAFASVNRVGG